MNQAVLAAGFFVAFFAALCLTPFVARLAKYKKWVDIPGGTRTVHHKPTPRAGGLAIILAFLGGFVYLALYGEGIVPAHFGLTTPSGWALLFGGCTIALTGLYDDAYGLGFKKKFLFQLIVAYTMYLAGYRIEVPAFELLASDPYLQAALGLPITILWYVGVMNAVNLIDGLDGLASGISLIIFTTLTILFSLNGSPGIAGILMAGALLGFLCYNFNPASIFMGDTGSLFIGFMIATYALQEPIHTSATLSLIIMGLVVGYPVLDTMLAFVRRFLKGKSPFAPDRDHIHHRMEARQGFTTRGAVVSLYGGQVLLCLAAVLLVVVEPAFQFATVLLVVLGLGVFMKWLGYLKVQYVFTLIRRRFLEQFEQRVPRGKWNGEGPGHPVLEVVASTSEITLPEQEDEREFVIQTSE